MMMVCERTRRKVSATWRIYIALPFVDNVQGEMTEIGRQSLISAAMDRFYGQSGAHW